MCHNFPISPLFHSNFQNSQIIITSFSFSFFLSISFIWLQNPINWAIMHLFWLTTIQVFSLSYHYLSFNFRCILSIRATKTSTLWRRKDNIGESCEGSVFYEFLYIYLCTFISMASIVDWIGLHFFESLWLLSLCKFTHFLVLQK